VPSDRGSCWNQQKGHHHSGCMEMQISSEKAMCSECWEWLQFALSCATAPSSQVRPHGPGRLPGPFLALDHYALPQLGALHNATIPTLIIASFDHQLKPSLLLLLPLPMPSLGGDICLRLACLPAAGQFACKPPRNALILLQLPTLLPRPDLLVLIYPLRGCLPCRCPLNPLNPL